MRKLPLLVTLVMIVLGVYAAAFPRVYTNPDPNHAHIDFAVWVDGKQMDFTGDAYQSGSSKEEPGSDDDEIDHKHPYLHLHDGNGNVLHSHKPGLTLKEFFTSIRLEFSGTCMTSGTSDSGIRTCSEQPFRIFVNGQERPFNQLSYVIKDLDHVLITNASTNAEVRSELQHMTDDACLYSLTCPWRGKPPVENCIADPAVPCTE